MLCCRRGVIWRPGGASSPGRCARARARLRSRPTAPAYPRVLDELVSSGRRGGFLAAAPGRGEPPDPVHLPQRTAAARPVAERPPRASPAARMGPRPARRRPNGPAPGQTPPAYPSSLPPDASGNNREGSRDLRSCRRVHAGCKQSTRRAAPRACHHRPDRWLGAQYPAFEGASGGQDDHVADSPVCWRCRRSVLVSADQYEVFEHMHYMCFNYEFEHNPVDDVGAECAAGGCPSASVSPRPVARSAIAGHGCR
jgi:hypothetical protein